MSHEEMHKEVEQIAIIGMAGRFPGARNVAEFWQNLKDGVESIRSFTQEELKASGIDDRTLKEPNFVNAGAVMDDADCFDAKFFGLSVREAEIMDPQHRVLLEVAWEALENAGYDSERFGGLIGVFGGVAPNTYFQQNLVRRPDLLQTVGRYPVMLGSEKDYAITRISFKLNLTGPSISVNTACSTSGVAVHLASQSLLLGECDMALAGGARIMVPLHGGYLCEEGGILSTDGRVRAFDAGAKGTVVGSGAAMIVLKRLSDAISDRDNILAVIKGSAINNDGSLKIGFTAPSVQGQTLVISEALAMADIDPETIGYIEAHGTGTALGDPIEVAALTSAFSKWTRKKGYCPIGTVKTNIGHLDAAAGVAGVIKTVLSLKHRQIPPSLNFNKANPQIDFDNSPVYVNTHLSEWPAGKTPRRAAVTVLGLGGTNAQIILEEPPEKGPSGPSRPHQLVLLSAKSAAALRGLTKNLADHLKEQPELNLADVSYTLQTGRQAFSHRRMVVCRDLADATVTLETMDSTRVRTSLAETTERDVVFMFSGQGSQYVNMGLELYQTEPVFREEIDRCSEILQPYLSRDLRQILYPEGNNLEEAAQMLQQTLFTQIALFVIEYGLAKLWMDWGVHPKAMVGHSIGEYVAACLAGVFSLEEALSLVVARSRLMQKLPGGSMLAVCLSEEEIQPFLGENLCLAAINGPALCTVSGDCEAIENLEKELSDNNGDCRPLHTSHAFHSKMMDPILDEFAETVRQFRLQSPRIPFLSNVSGNWITAEQATDPTYWANHLRQTVRFSCCIGELLQEPGKIFLEIGPGRTLSTLVRQHQNGPKQQIVLSSLRHPQEESSDVAFLLNTVGSLWLAGLSVDWDKFYANERRHRVTLPTYPFARVRHWVDPGRQPYVATSVSSSLSEQGECAFQGGLIEPLPDTAVSSDAVPGNEMEQTIAKIWQDLLGVKEVSIHDNFFELGGSSLVAVRLFNQIEKTLGKKLPPSVIFQAPTIKQLANVLPQEVDSMHESSLVKIQHGCSGRSPLYCLPGNLGNVFKDLGHLTRHLGKDQPVYGLQDNMHHPSKIEALAEHYLEDIRTVQPEGPYYLLGICAGGVVAFEMAQQLVHQGDSVALLALVEPASLPLPGVRSYLSMAGEVWDRFSRRSGIHSRNVSQLYTVEKWMYIRLRLKMIANLWAMKRYVPRPYPGRIQLFLASESLRKPNRPRLGWRAFGADGVEVHEIPGTHDSITGNNDTPIDEGHMRVLAEKLRACTDETLEDTKGT